MCGGGVCVCIYINISIYVDRKILRYIDIHNGGRGTETTTLLYTLALNGLDSYQRQSTWKGKKKKQACPFKDCIRWQKPLYESKSRSHCPAGRLFQASKSQIQETHSGRRSRWVTPSCADKKARQSLWICAQWNKYLSSTRPAKQATPGNSFSN